MDKIPHERNSYLIVFVLCLITASLSVVLVFDIPLDTGSEQEQDRLGCFVADKHNQYMKEDWLLSNNISSYEDIPVKQRRNLSKASRDWLNVSHPGKVREYNPTAYHELPEGQRRLFITALNNTTTFNESRLWMYNSYSPYVLYKGEMYRCDVLRTPVE